MLIPRFYRAGAAPDDKKFFKLGDSGAVLEIWPRKGAGALLFYPGTMVAPGHYRAFLLAAQRAGFAIAGLHLTGHGRNDDGRFTFDSLLGQGLDAEKWLWENGYGPVAVCGHSQGGILAMAHGGRSSSIAGAFSLCAVFPRMARAIDLTHFAFLWKYRATILKYIKKAAALLPRLSVPLPFYLSLGEIFAGAREPLLSGGDKGRISYPLEFLASLFDADINNSLKCPFRLYAAINDELFTPALTQEVFACVRSRRKKVIWLRDGGHLFPLNPELAEFVARDMAAACAGLGFPIMIGGE